ncbi:hypothetical protein ACHHRT_03905 [Desulfurivibrio sp. D14AmB]|uniref:hypothetical protein n=1 Tax=Desulfurivibrio sp. D14AmB TaxID=3374370 RepID=UPI00376ECADB
MKNLIAILLLTLLAAGCGQEKREVIGTNAGPPPADGHLVQVGESFITSQDLANELAGMPASRRLNYTVPGGEERLLDEMIKREMFRQEAIAAGLDQSPAYRQRVEYLSRLALVEMFLEEKIQDGITISDREVREYYEEHQTDEFTNPVSGEIMPLTSVRENIRRFLVMEKQRELFDAFLEELMAKYVVKLASE